MAGLLGKENYFVGLLPEAELSLDVLFLGVLDVSALPSLALEEPLPGLAA
jgi:hypothetical protein